MGRRQNEVKEYTLKERLAEYGDIFARPDIRKSKAFCRPYKEIT